MLCRLSKVRRKCFTKFETKLCVLHIAFENNVYSKAAIEGNDLNTTVTFAER